MSSHLAERESSTNLNDLNMDYASSPITDENNPLELVFAIHLTENEKRIMREFNLEDLSNFHIPGSYYGGQDIDAYINFLSETWENFGLTEISFYNFKSVF